MKKRTKPKQAASARQLDRWQREVLVIIGLLDPFAGAYWGNQNSAMTRLRRLLRSMGRAERR